MNYMALALLHLIARLREPRARLSHETGQTLAEYGLVITLVAIGVTVAALLFFSTALAGAFDSATACFTGAC